MVGAFQPRMDGAISKARNDIERMSRRRES